MRRFVPPNSNQKSVVRLLSAVSVAAALALTTISAQIPSRNVNMVSGTSWPEGDPFLQRQNEPSLAASTRNPLHLLGGSNDYRTVDVPGLPCLEFGPDPADPTKQICVREAPETGDAWLGLFKSSDGGQRWNSGLLPGYPQDKSPAGLKSPLKGFQAGADPVVRAGTHGMMYFSGLVFDRAENGKSGIFLARFIDNNNQEAGDSFAYLGATMVAQSTGAAFLDKPWMAVDIPRDNNPVMCQITEDSIIPTRQDGRRRRHGYDRHERRDRDDDDRDRGRGNDRGRNDRDRGRGNDRDDDRRHGRPRPTPPPMLQLIPAGAIYVVYSSITGDEDTLRSEILLKRSMDCGATWSAPIRVSRAEDRINQGAHLAIDPRTGAVYVGWRRFDPDLSDNTDLDAIMVARLPYGAGRVDSPGHAHRFGKPTRKVGRQLHRLFEHRGNRFKKKAVEAAENLDQFDLGTTGFNFRTNAYPAMTADGSGRIYLAWTQRGFAADSGPGDGARIVIATTRDGRNFTKPIPVDNHADPGRGHQLMPSMAFAGGKLMLVFYDLRESKAELPGGSVAVHDRIISDANKGIRHTIDIRSAMASPGDYPQFPQSSVKVSDYLAGYNPRSGVIEELQVNPPNLPMFKLGTAPFMGDYIDVTAAPAFVPSRNGRWAYNTEDTGRAPVFHAAWTDNRDVRPPTTRDAAGRLDWTKYTPVKMSPNQVPGPSLFDPSMTVPICDANDPNGSVNPGSRNQNIYSARITGGLLAGSPGNAKPLSPDLQRSFVVFAQNTAIPDPGNGDDGVRSFRMRILSQPPGGRASFSQFPLPPYSNSSAPPLTSIEMIVPARSTAVRTVYVTSSDPKAQINVDVEELVDLRNLPPASYPTAQVKSDGAEARVLLNPDIENPDIENPDIENPDIENPDIENAEVYNPDIENPDIENPDIENPDIENPDIENPDIENPDIENPDIENVRVANPDIENPDIENPDIENPDIENPDIENPDIENPDIENGAIQDITWQVTNTGNTTAAFNVNLFLAQQNLPQGIHTQLILLKTYRTPVAVPNGCQLGFQTRNILLANIPNPKLVAPDGEVSDPNDPAEQNATMWLAPGEEGRIVMRVFDDDPSDNVLIPKTDQNGNPILDENGNQKMVSVDRSVVPSEDVTPVVQQQSVNSEDAEDGVTEPPITPGFPAPQTVADFVSTAELTPVTVNVLANDSTAFGSTKVISLHPAGMATHSGTPPGDIAFQPSTGFVYTQRGAIDPASDALVGRFPSPVVLGGIPYLVPNPRTGINYARTNAASNTSPAVLVALDARPDGTTFHRYLPMPVVTDSVYAFGLDSTHHRLYVAHGPNTGALATSISAVDINPASATFHQVLYTFALPGATRGQAVAVNSRTRKVYVAASGGGGGGVYVFDGSTPAAPAPLKVTGTFNGLGIGINEANNLVFVTTALAPSNPQPLIVYAIDGATNAMTQINTTVPLSFGSNEERIAVHQASGRVFVRTANRVVVIDGQRGSPTRNTVIAEIAVGAESGGTDLAIDQELGLVVTTGNVDFRSDIISVATNAVVATIPNERGGSDVAIDPFNHRAFVSVGLTHVQEIDLQTLTRTASVTVFVESGGTIVNPVTNKAYTGITVGNTVLGKVSGAGFEGLIPGTITTGRFLFAARHEATNRFFIVNPSNVGQDSSANGTVTVIDGNTDTPIAPDDALAFEAPPSPFGIGINQASGRVYVATLAVPGQSGTIMVANANDLEEEPVLVDTSAIAPLAPTAFIGFGRHVIVNPVNGKVYVNQLGSSNTSIAVIDPVTNVATPLDGAAGLPLGNSFGRAEVIRVDPVRNRVYVAFYNPQTDVNTVVSLDSATDTLLNTWQGGRHSNRHTASYLVVNPATNRVFVSNYLTHTVTMLNGDTLLPLATAAVPNGPSAMVVNESANRVYVSSIDAKTITAIDGSAPGSMAITSSVRLPLVAYFLHVDEDESRIYTSGGDSMDESGVMVVTDVLGQLGTNVSVTGAAATTNGSVVLNPDYSITYTPNLGFSGVDTFTYDIAAPTGTASGTVTVTVLPSHPAPVAFGDGYNVGFNQPLTVDAPGPMANDVPGVEPEMVVTDTTDFGTLSPQSDGSFLYQPNPGFLGTDSFKYQTVGSLGTSNTVTVTITVVAAQDLVVTNTSDAGPGSLRLAMATSTVEPNSAIRFAIPGAGPHVITAATPLPALTAPVIIDGYTQAGASPNTLPVGTNAVIQIQVQGGGGLPAFTNGLQVNGGNSYIRGLSIVGFPGSGIVLDAAPGNHVEGNFVGVTAGGAAMGNGTGGITSLSANNLIGDTPLAARNLVSGNTNGGVRVLSKHSGGVLQGAGTGTIIVNNLIGTDRLALAAIPNTNGGITVTVANVTIGGAAAAARNIVAGNLGTGISSNASTFDADGAGGANPVAVTQPANLTVQGNYVGVSGTGTALPNTGHGIQIHGDALIGGTSGVSPLGCTGACNVISGNGNNGVSVNAHVDDATGTVFSSGEGTRIAGNYIGVNPAGTAAVPNGPPGAFSAGIGAGVRVIVGGASAQDRNVISGNNATAINLFAQLRSNGTVAQSAADSQISNNYIGLGPDGSTAIPNAGTAITISTRNVTVGGNLPSDRNVISGNGGQGVNAFAQLFDPDGPGGPLPNAPVADPAASGANLRLRHNYIGTDANGSAARPNGFGGVSISSPGAIVNDNVISGNGNAAVSLNHQFDLTTGTVHSAASPAQIGGNIIGLTASGLLPLPNNGVGINVNTPAVTIGGPLGRNVIAANTGTGIVVTGNITSTNQRVGAGAEGTVIAGNYIGLDSTGETPQPNGGGGIFSASKGVTIGGATAAEGNLVIAQLNTRAINLGQHLNGATLVHAGGESIVQNNTIGLSATGARLDQRGSAIGVSSAQNQLLDNVIAGNGINSAPFPISISIAPAGGTVDTANNNVVRGNYIGTNKLGAMGLHNYGPGISINNVSGTMIGGGIPAHRNVIVHSASGTFGDLGIFIGAGPGHVANLNTIAGNYVGVMPDGVTPQDPAFRNGTGIQLFTVGAGAITNTTIGGPSANDGNLVAHNGFSGVALLGNVTGARVLGNRIFNNGGGGIDLAGNGVTANDPGDADSGPNNLQNFPVLSNATNTPGPTTRVTADLSSFITGAGVSYTLNFFASTACDASGHGEGERFLIGFTGIAGGGSSNFTLPEAVPDGQFITATATDQDGNTSEFSACAEVGATSGFVVTNTNDSGAGSLRDAMTTANSTPGMDLITFNIPGLSLAAPGVIDVASPLPAISEQVAIDGRTQPGWAGIPLIEVQGPGTTSGWVGFAVNASNVTIAGLSITQFADGILAGAGRTGISIRENAIGVTPAMAAAGNLRGVQYLASNGQVYKNVISGNGEGLLLIDGASGNTVEENHIGLAADGVAPVPNTGNGVVLYNGANNNGFISNVISGNGGWGVDIQHSGALAQVSGTTFRFNKIGLDINGDLVPFAGPDIVGETSFGPIVNFGPENRGNRAGGIHVNNAPGTAIGTGAGNGNFISGNSFHGILVDNTAAPGVQIIANVIGLDPTGSSHRGNTRNGIALVGSRATIGGPSSGELNVVSGNILNGITVQGGGSAAIGGNKIGTNLSGTTVTDSNSRPLGNGKLTLPDYGCCHAGIFLDTTGNTVSNNVISGNAIGVRSTTPAGGPGSANVIADNYIGTGSGGGGSLGNATGVFLAGDQTGSQVLRNTIMFNQAEGVLIAEGSVGATIGGTQPNANTISLNNRGVVVGYDAAATDSGHVITFNNISNHSGIGLDLANDGHTANDAGDGDGGPNGRQNFPVITSAVLGGPGLQMVVDTTSFANTSHDLHFYSVPSCHVSGFGEGVTYLGTANVTAPGVQNIDLAVSVAAGWYITATATRSLQGTSEFSACRQVVVIQGSISSAAPQPSATGHGQLLTIDGTGMPATAASHVIFEQGGSAWPATFVWTAGGSRIIARLPVELAPGPATVRATNGAVHTTAPFAISVSAAPSAPILHTLFQGSCSGGFNPINTNPTIAGTTVALEATGIDTNGVTTTLVWTPVFGGAPVVDPGATTCNGASGRVHTDGFVVPPFAPGTYVRLQIQTTTAGGTSALSNPLFLTVEDVTAGAGYVESTSGSIYMFQYAPNGHAGTAIRGVRSAGTIDRLDFYASPLNYPMAGGEALVYGSGAGSGTPYDLSCPANMVLTGIFGYISGVVPNPGDLTQLGLRCKDPQFIGAGGSTTVGPVGVPSASFFDFSCPAGTKVVGLPGRSSATSIHGIGIACR